jgi:hypothetical protein
VQVRCDQLPTSGWYVACACWSAGAGVTNSRRAVGTRGECVFECECKRGLEAPTSRAASTALETDAWNNVILSSSVLSSVSAASWSAWHQAWQPSTSIGGIFAMSLGRVGLSTCTATWAMVSMQRTVRPACSLTAKSACWRRRNPCKPRTSAGVCCLPPTVRTSSSSTTLRVGAGAV